jgi:hypothetical protein
MQNPIPHFAYDPPRNLNAYTARILSNGVPIHQIKDLEGFFRDLGYMAETKKAGALAEEFIWEEYTKDNLAARCLQMRIIEYLVKNSVAFLGEYGNQYQNWFDEHVKAVTENNFLCITCKMKSFCQIGISIPKIPTRLSNWLRGILGDDQ